MWMTAVLSPTQFAGGYSTRSYPIASTTSAPESRQPISSRCWMPIVNMHCSAWRLTTPLAMNVDVTGTPRASTNARSCDDERVRITPLPARTTGRLAFASTSQASAINCASGTGLR